MLSKLFRKKKKEPQEKKPLQKKPNERGKAHISKRKGEIGEYKIDIQLDQMPKEYKHMSDLLIENPKSKSGYSQVDHVLITSYGIFVIETKNHQGTVYGGKDRKTWSVNGKFRMMNPFFQNYGHIQALKKIIGEKYEGSMVSIVSFTKRCTFKIDTNLRDIKENQLIVYDMELSEFINRKIHVQKLIHKQPLITAEEVQHIYGEIKKQHISNPDVLKRHVEALNDTSETTRSTCVVCEKEVSNKVKSFCLNNKKFEGKIYCYDHQK